MSGDKNAMRKDMSGCGCRYKLRIEILEAEGGGLAGLGHELVEGVDALHIFHDTESEVRSYPVSGFHEGDGLGHEGFDLILGALRAPVEVLASELSCHNRFVESDVPKFHVCNKARRGDVVVMDTHMGYAAFPVASFKPIFDPCHAGRSRARSRGNERVIAFIPQGLDIFNPELGAVGRRHV